MKIKPYLKLRRIGNRHIVVDTDASCIDLTSVYTLNDTAAAIWTAAAAMPQIDADALTTHMVDTYDVDRDTADDDVRLMLGQWQAAGLITD